MVALGSTGVVPSWGLISSALAVAVALTRPPTMRAWPSRRMVAVCWVRAVARRPERAKVRGV